MEGGHPFKVNIEVVKTNLDDYDEILTHLDILKDSGKWSVFPTGIQVPVGIPL